MTEFEAMGRRIACQRGSQPRAAAQTCCFAFASAWARLIWSNFNLSRLFFIWHGPRQKVALQSGKWIDFRNPGANF
jgi:hypothetical protein